MNKAMYSKNPHQKLALLASLLLGIVELAMGEAYCWNDEGGGVCDKRPVDDQTPAVCRRVQREFAAGTFEE